MKKITRNEARNAGFLYYFTGKPCSNGHTSERYVSTCACVSCNSSRSDQKKDWYRKNKEKVIKRVSEHYQKNRQEKIAYQCDYQKRNLKKIQNHRKRRMKSDPVYAIKERVRCLIKESVRKSSARKYTKTAEILGCSVVELREHIERQFLRGMSWENMGEWHIDHIVPISSASSEEEVIALNHHTNLRPLWARENLRKSNKMEFLI